MRLVVCDDYDGVSEWAAQYVADSINAKRAAAPAIPFVLGLPTGSTPIGMYQRLVSLNKSGALSFADVHSFNMDEYVGLAETNPQSYHAFMRQHLFDHIDMPRANWQVPNGNASDLDVECDRYEDAIIAAGGVDLWVGGIGVDGHIAFNEPGSSLTSRTRIKTLTRETREVNSRFFDDDIDAVPKTALTAGVGTIMEAYELMILVSGVSKARALRHAIEEGVNHMWTLSCVQLHPRAIIVCDEDATSDLRVSTVRYFKRLEADRAGSF